MARQKIKFQCDLSDRETKRRLISSIGAMQGLYEVDIQPRRNQRSNQQSRWYWSCVCTALADYLSDQDYDVTTPEAAHEVMKARFLATSVVNKRTGEVLCRRVRSTTELTTEEFSTYCERCRAWLADFFNVYVPDPDPAYQAKETVPA